MFYELFILCKSAIEQEYWDNIFAQILKIKQSDKHIARMSLYVKFNENGLALKLTTYSDFYILINFDYF